ncbi:uncharacterized protein SEPMUDRAFT_149916 [Sphaerulina musiva SO2202]|uniref:Uncharacterized protein n=1 Tax=Sphaerulina musiva (strain SO2202) TaxID=692275 RepID=N1QK31_SPHMS|nr:uncharacterized protein SEPMUDRAFT_149916 [Sphaerulina musiva SO2202]EMF12170.1 hypothetical protein SEPMUDRAFT_149916 [Sphaerulina musiva SO2202]
MPGHAFVENQGTLWYPWHGGKEPRKETDHPAEAADVKINNTVIIPRLRLQRHPSSITTAGHARKLRLHTSSYDLSSLSTRPSRPNVEELERGNLHGYCVADACRMPILW